MELHENSQVHSDSAQSGLDEFHRPLEFSELLARAFESPQPICKEIADAIVVHDFTQGTLLKIAGRFTYSLNGYRSELVKDLVQDASLNLALFLKEPLPHKPRNQQIPYMCGVFRNLIAGALRNDSNKPISLSLCNCKTVADDILEGIADYRISDDNDIKLPTAKQVIEYIRRWPESRKKHVMLLRFARKPQSEIAARLKIKRPRVSLLNKQGSVQIKKRFGITSRFRKPPKP